MSDQLDRLVEKRANIWEQAKTHLDTVEAAGDDASGEAEQTWERYNADLDALDKRIAEVTKNEQRQAEADAARAIYGEAARPAPVDKREERPSDEDVLRKMVAGEIRGHDFHGERRDLTVGSSTAGGNTVPTSFFAQLQEHLVEVSAIRQTNVQVLTTESGEALQVPKTTAHSSAAPISEGGTITESDPTFGQVTLNAYKYGLSMQISHELEQDTAINLTDYLARQAGRAIGIATGAAYLVGDGSSKPQGIVPASTVGKTGANSVAGVFTADNLIDLYFSVIAPYRANASWMMADGALASLRKLKDGVDGQYLWQPALTAGEPSTLLGKPVFADTNVPDQAAGVRSVLFGDFSAYMIRDVAGVRAERSVDFAFGSDLVTWRFLFRTDGELIDTTGAVKCFIGGTA